MITCIAIDDELLALELLEDNIRRTPFLQLSRSFTSSIEAIEFLRGNAVDLMFLDIHMPDLSGIQLLKLIQPKPLVILITAFEKYALQGFELDVVDYLMKPVSYDRFLKAAGKARELISLKRAAVVQIPETPAGGGFFFVKSDYKQIRIDFNEIMYIEGLKDYVKIYSGDRPVLTQMSIKSILEKIPETDFMRIHRSYIVNLTKIQFVQRMQVRIGNKDIPVGESYRDAFFQRLNLRQTPM